MPLLADFSAMRLRSSLSRALGFDPGPERAAYFGALRDEDEAYAYVDACIALRTRLRLLAAGGTAAGGGGGDALAKRLDNDNRHASLGAAPGDQRPPVACMSASQGGVAAPPSPCKAEASTARVGVDASAAAAVDPVPPTVSPNRPLSTSTTGLPDQPVRAGMVWVRLWHCRTARVVWRLRKAKACPRPVDEQYFQSEQEYLSLILGFDAGPERMAHRLALPNLAAAVAFVQECMTLSLRSRVVIAAAAKAGRLATDAAMAAMAGAAGAVVVAPEPSFDHDDRYASLGAAPGDQRQPPARMNTSQGGVVAPPSSSKAEASTARMRVDASAAAEVDLSKPTVSTKRPPSTITPGLPDQVVPMVPTEPSGCDEQPAASGTMPLSRDTPDPPPDPDPAPAVSASPTEPEAWLPTASPAGRPTPPGATAPGRPGGHPCASLLRHPPGRRRREGGVMIRLRAVWVCVAVMMALAGCARLLPSAAPPSTRTETLPPHKYVINRGLAVLAAIPRWMKSLTGSRDQLMLGPGPPWDPDPRPPSEVRFSDRRRLSSAGAGVSDSGQVDAGLLSVGLRRSAVSCPVSASSLVLSPSELCEPFSPRVPVQAAPSCFVPLVVWVLFRAIGWLEVEFVNPNGKPVPRVSPFLQSSLL